MTKRPSVLHRLRETRAVAAIEFAVALPVFLMATLGIFDLAYEQYAGAVLQGVVDKAGRDGTLEGYAEDQGDLDDYIKRKVREVWPGAQVDIERQSFKSFRSASERNKPERFTDANGDGKYDKGECFEDTNGNGKYDRNRGNGNKGNGAAEDVVLLTATITMNRIFPGWQLLGQSQEAEVVATMMLKNQPFAAGGSGLKMICGDDDDDQAI